ncbi:hypothetical protein OGR47_01880 [Methylocystis sp. MJC1]|jgi:hypothetical protein|uniref:hypothetical protein n=1 Tax=Methylocystis sp. MJC1 TaxID=2654282 RepID=UPI0013ED2396|nr:hypothetical protein [Methylocystis sp. MJC1]KAF2990578.1 hypothetical protein MJC1_02340 [Methylocystis sp. MJC1]MBU6525761.1 hypothetical protein [Methylocystis sp. MJC1]UZX12229.1 hypothetical protein OGR47_01880 [Methylocystis sp. MJC1]
MSRRTLIYFVCSPHSRTGVTTAARLLTDYYLSRGVPVEGFDTDSREPNYALRFPGVARVVDIGDVKGQISLFDRLLVADDAPKIVDVWSRSYDQLFATIAEIGFLEEARNAGVEPIILFQSDSSQTAASNARLLNTTWPNLWLTVIHNEGAAPLRAEALDILAHYPARGKLVIPKLESAIAAALDDVDVSLSTFLCAPPSHISIVVRAALKAWLLPIFTQFQSFEMRMNLQSSEFLR